MHVRVCARAHARVIYSQGINHSVAVIQNDCRMTWTTTIIVIAYHSETENSHDINKKTRFPEMKGSRGLSIYAEIDTLNTKPLWWGDYFPHWIHQITHSESSPLTQWSKGMNILLLLWSLAAKRASKPMVFSGSSQSRDREGLNGRVMGQGPGEQPVSDYLPFESQYSFIHQIAEVPTTCEVLFYTWAVVFKWKEKWNRRKVYPMSKSPIFQ